MLSTGGSKVLVLHARMSFERTPLNTFHVVGGLVPRTRYNICMGIYSVFKASSAFTQSLVAVPVAERTCRHVTASRAAYRQLGEAPNKPQ